MWHVVANLETVTIPWLVSSIVSLAASLSELNAWEVKYSLITINKVYPKRPNSKHAITAYLEEFIKCTG